MAKVRLTTEEIMKIGFFEKIANVPILDCVLNDERVAFIVKEGDVGAAIGKGGENVKTAEEKFGKKVDIIEYSDDWRKFIRNIFAPIQLDDVWVKRVGKDVVAFIKINPKVRRAVFGEKGKNLERALKILKRHTKITKIKVIVENQKFKRKRAKRPVVKDQQQEQTETKQETDVQQDVKETVKE
ncbi:putative transcription termination-antitermination factor (NusA) [Methanocaldococcus jannaschii DSM 2661]|uniref:Probable transcription termination protein NusA n=1 Tax=Methanocaldococcus jannaschii (strain ATCC 43067 / DSM 2661 / JAL-1 / JCM 10045 / NBRC 100440) TaxID=243232 RepID=NUSA_METJA|nr:NusA-like transcription termination signal-binding factor [Methanocaldococcus jannaschii]Q58447.1 RecName: Full=Probable transcription termination protein NusA [Methanocaldococcus jannaschii DSM 2661]AAB99049.1 putative transcription termination-antitermination factor (NusA) [Methanocaldococcus jannaschii DSM 2661]